MISVTDPPQMTTLIPASAIDLTTFSHYASSLLV